jgi:RNA polymerase sigma factor (sigma-70 family)
MTDSSTSFDVARFAESLITARSRRDAFFGFAFKWHRIDPADAEDLLQEAIQRLLRYRDRVRNPEAYVWSVFRNLCKRFRRAGAGFVIGRTERHLEAGEDPAEAESLDAKVRVREALSRISRRCRQVLKAYCIEEMSHREIARIAHLAESSVAKTIRRCLRRLQECLG